MIFIYGKGAAMVPSGYNYERKKTKDLKGLYLVSLLKWLCTVQKLVQGQINSTQ